MREFPVKVTLPNGDVCDPAMVLRDGDRVQVFAAARDARNLPGVHVQSGRRNGDQIVRLADLHTPDEQRHGRIRYLTAADSTIRVEPSGGCGCGHPLKKFRPKAAV